jgi:tetratricopeptide (TPR) repeat protein
MRPKLWLIAFAFCFVSGGPAALADDQEACLCSSDSCHFYEDENIEPGLRACTRMIQSRRYVGTNLAIIYRARGFWRYVKHDYEVALRDYDEAIRLDPKNPTGYDQRADVRQAKGEFDLALDDLNTALGVDPLYAPAYYDRGEVYREKGDLVGARAEYHAALAVARQDGRTKYVQDLAREKLADIVQSSAFGLEAISADDESEAVFSGEWAGTGQRRADSLTLKESDLGSVTGQWVGEAGDVSVSGIHGVSSSVVLTGWSNRGAIRIIATVEGDEIRLTYVAGSFEGTSKLVRKKAGEENAGARGGDGDAAAAYGNSKHYFPKDVAEDDNAAVCSNGTGDPAIAACTRQMRELQEYPGALASLRWQRGQHYGAKGEYDLAIRDFDESLRLAEVKAVARFVGQAWVYNQRGQTYGMKGDYDRAIVDFTEALRREPKFAAALFNRGQTYRAKGSFTAAVADFSAAIELDPDYATAYRMRGATYHAMRNYDAAIDDYTKAIALIPDYAAAWGGRGLSYLAKGEHELASRDFQSAMKLNPADAEIAKSRDLATNLQVCLKLGASTATGSKACSFLIADRSLPADVRARAYRERASGALQSAAKQADFDRVLSDLSEVLHLAPQDAAAVYRLRSGVYSRLGEADRALEEISRAIELDRSSLAAYVGRSLIYASKGDRDRAIADIDAAIRLEPRRAALYVLRGDAWFAKSNMDRARADFERAVELDPVNTQGAGALAWARRAEMQNSAGNIDAAIANYGEAIKIAPRDADAYVGRAILFRVKGQLLEAAQDFDKALVIIRAHRPRTPAARLFGSPGATSPTRRATLPG